MANHRVKLPHPELQPVLSAMARSVIETRSVSVAGTHVEYDLFTPTWETHDIDAAYSESGRILVSTDLVSAGQRYADLAALHEHVEIQHKVAGRSHAYAHRRAFVHELLPAGRIFQASRDDLASYIAWRIGAYPPDKVPLPYETVQRLLGILTTTPVRKGKLLEVVTRYHL
jgi:hypothetical protein